MVSLEFLMSSITQIQRKPIASFDKAGVTKAGMTSCTTLNSGWEFNELNFLTWSTIELH